MSMDQVATMQRVITLTGSVVDGIEPEQLDNPSPCEAWTVRDVLNHITAGAEMFAICVRDGEVSDEKLGEIMMGDRLGDDYKASFHRAADDANAAFAIPGAMDRIVKLPFGETPACSASRSRWPTTRRWPTGSPGWRAARRSGAPRQAGSASPTGVQSRSNASATAGFTTWPSAVFTPAASSGSLVTASRTPR